MEKGISPWLDKPKTAPSSATTADSHRSRSSRGAANRRKNSDDEESLATEGGEERDFKFTGASWRLRAPFWVQRDVVDSNGKYTLAEMIVLPPHERKHSFKPDAQAGWEGFYARTLEAAKRPPATAVVLLYSAEFSPFTTCDLDALQRARTSIHSRYPEARVVGAVVAPYPDKRCAKPPPFRARVELARRVVAGTQHCTWIVVDGCLEACLRKCETPIAPHVAVYARSRLHCPGCRAKVIEVHTVDTMVATGEPLRPFDCLFVGRGGVEPHPEYSPQLSELRGVIVDVPKHRLCGDALRAEAAASIALGGLTRRDLLRYE